MGFLLQRILSKMADKCIMGFAHGPDYNWSVVRPFIRSLREQATFDGDIVLFTNNKPNESGFKEADRNKLNEYQVTEIQVDLTQVAPWGQGFMMARFWQQEKTIRENPQWIRLVLVDTRDMIWQSNLGKFFQDDELHAQREEIVIQDDKWFNSAGILASWGQEILDEVGDKPVLNSGSVWGGRNSLINLLEKMRSCGAKPNCDQHALNMLIHRGIVGAIQHPNDGEYIWTIGAMPGAKHIFESGRVYMPDSKLPPCVHQYDRHAALKDKIWEYYDEVP